MPGAAPRHHVPRERPGVQPHHEGVKDVKLAQKLGQLWPFTAVFPPECAGHILGQPNTVLAARASRPRSSSAASSSSPPRSVESVLETPYSYE
jgi:hypothetical protein